MPQVIEVKKDGCLFQAFLEGGKQTGSFMTIDTALLALLFINGDKLDAWTRSRLAVLAEDYSLDKAIAPADVEGITIKIGEGRITVEGIRKQFQFPPEATKRWRVTHDDFPGVIAYVWRSVINQSGVERYQCGDTAWITSSPDHHIAINWFKDPERMHWEVIENES